MMPLNWFLFYCLHMLKGRRRIRRQGHFEKAGMYFITTIRL